MACVQLGAFGISDHETYSGSQRSSQITLDISWSPIDFQQSSWKYPG